MKPAREPLLDARNVARIEPLTYAVFTGVLVIVSACVFYGAEKLQLFYSWVHGDPYALASDWSAPLDDVFIHFDFARSAARGHPFEWVVGNGYSSGGTSLLYPLVLAPGYRLGFHGLRLMEFAATVATTSVFATLLASRRLFRALPRWTSYLAPPLLLSIGALQWSLWSGMEVAFFLAVWGLCLITWDDLTSEQETNEGGGDAARAVALGLSNALLVATRPEAFVVVGVFAISAALAVRSRRGNRAGFSALLVTSSFAVVVLVASSVANRVLTGDWSAAGALVKLEAYDPRLTAKEAWDAWLFHVRYQIARVTGHHVADGLLIGSILWVLAALPIGFEKTRRLGLLLWSQSILWVLVVAMNGQVRWQNERYTMPALAWMLLAAALGLGALLSSDLGERGRLGVRRGTAACIVLLSLFTLGWAQASQMRDQIWFFGRASRNIRDQHVVAARRIRYELPGTRRVLVGDAGAIPYASDLPALDIIGLGGFEKLPFARASRWGVAAAIELIERVPASARPDLMAIYPGWWGDFPLWFGTPVTGVSVRGNVICGGLTKMIYRADFRPLDLGRSPSKAAGSFEVFDEIDPGDVVNEAAHGLRVSGALGFVAMKLLPHLGDPTQEVWDAGRVVPAGASLSFAIHAGAHPRRRLVLRVAPSQSARVRVSLDGTSLGVIELHPTEGWSEPSVALPQNVPSDATVTLSVEHEELVFYHLWDVEER